MGTEQFGWEERIGKASRSGFTIVELLIVIVVIAILAAITVVAYSGIQNRTYDSAVKADLVHLAKKFEEYKIKSSSGLYPFGNPTLETLDFKLGNRNVYAVAPAVSYNLLNCTSSTIVGSNYGLAATSKSGKRFYITSEAGRIEEYTGGAWSTLASICTSILAGSTGNGAGYSDSDTPQWRVWTD